MDGLALDPRAILTSIGEVVYDWDAATDRISWGINAADVLGGADLSILSSGREFALATEPGSGSPLSITGTETSVNLPAGTSLLTLTL